MDRGLRKLSGL